MNRNDQGLQEHWERIYQEKGPQDVSWTQEVPTPSLDLIKGLDLSSETRIIDLGGGDSKLVDHLLKEGYRDITVLDLSEKALEKASARLGEDARYVEWVASDVLDYAPKGAFDLWHDRATFHFLTDPEDVKRYRELVQNAVKGYMLIGTFSDQGPEKCSGLPVQRYNEEEIEKLFSQEFELLRTWREDHITPGGTSQNFLFAGFKRKKDQVSEL